MPEGFCVEIDIVKSITVAFRDTSTKSYVMASVTFGDLGSHQIVLEKTCRVVNLTIEISGHYFFNAFFRGPGDATLLHHIYWFVFFAGCCWCTRCDGISRDIRSIDDEQGKLAIFF